ncbi:2,3-diphosphoglycerate-dependent phosphoglycerate mutase [Virgibacillus soli]|uniref:2,3-bisphosphoglycerate-dependent phosphoglycerate mutase n=1 Tax=Paracerasibacillus soli TaxID=480284 RepID=A0ABU5CRC5_9BACI|nr:2,3-diphosphoglycerate-dependent phosphoglycerate mutase [Virgibacillus soli]MDY0407993.1 2,3-diphosphoglycerate-dependent phosphoglycerate mutase [Virgibacillus soli]
MKKIVFIRHGQSKFNLENRFTGWLDVDLTDEGYNQAREAGKILSKHGLTFDIGYTSVLKRAIRTLWIILHEMDLMWIPLYKTWRLNERHYGDLQGKSKADITTKYGEKQVHEWRRSAHVRPPKLDESTFEALVQDPKYQNMDKTLLPYTENLIDTEKRVLQYWHHEIVPQLNHNKHIIVAAHGNTIRALVQYLDKKTDDEIANFNIPNTVPFVYELDENLIPLRSYYLE